MATIGDRLKELGHDLKRGWQASLARHCGVKPPSVADWVSGKSKSLEGENLLKAAEFFGVTPTWLATGRGPKLASEGQRTSAPMESATGLELGNLPLEYRRVLEDLADLPPARRSKMMDQIHQAAEEVREAVQYHSAAPPLQQTTVAAAPAAARRPSKKHTAYLTWGDGNARQGTLPLTTVPDPFTAEPDVREAALYTRFAHSPRN